MMSCPLLPLCRDWFYPYLLGLVHRHWGNRIAPVPVKQPWRKWANRSRKECPYALRDSSILMRPKVNMTQYGLKSFRSYGAKIWNHLPVSYKARISLSEFKTLIKSWDGPKCKCSVCALYTWPDLLFTSFYINVGTHVYICGCMYMYVCMYMYMYVRVCMYICVSYFIF